MLGAWNRASNRRNFGVGIHFNTLGGDTYKE